MSTIPSWLEDGKPSKTVRVRNLKPGMTLLGWNGEPFSLGVVERVENVPRQSYGSVVRRVFLIHYADGRVIEAAGDDWRRVLDEPS